ncbi:hypothetical protein BGX27_001480 [Mortierella sp. AM989]|nr:hypothetical protein BGX27_001480 [Mortierella sp. AM989]
MPAAPSKAKVATATITTEPTEGKAVDNVTSNTTTTVVTSVEETVATLEVTNSSSVVQITKVDVTTSVAVSTRELPIFRNPLIVNAAIDALGALSVKPKAARVKATPANKSATVAVLKLTAPKAEGEEIVIMRRMDSDLVNASAMFNAAYPSISEEMQEKEMDYIKTKYETQGVVVEKPGSGVLAGVWVTISQAKVLAEEYGIEQFIQPLLEAPSRKSTIKAAAASVAISASISTEVSAEETTQKVEQEQEPEEEEQKSNLETLVVTAEGVIVKEEITVSEDIVVSTKAKEDTEKTEETNEETKDEEQEEQEEKVAKPETIVMKRGIEEPEEEATRDRKRYRGLLTAAAVGLVAVAAIPQVIPYFS